MATKSYFRGWIVVWVDNKGNKETRVESIPFLDIEKLEKQDFEGLDGYWVYEDNGERLPATGGKIRPCKKCGKSFPLGEGEVDPCLGILPGVDNACCGHGVTEYSYIRFLNGLTVVGYEILLTHQACIDQNGE